MELPTKVMIIGSGAIKIGEAAEFDYSGSQALKALKEEGIKSILVNPNVATVQTTHKLADRVYLVPLKKEIVKKVIEKERPDGIMFGFGGQTALTLGVELWQDGILQKYGVKVYGTPIEGIIKATDKTKFRELMDEWGIPMPPSKGASNVEEAIEIARELGYPVIVRTSFALGGRGSIIAWNEDELKRWVERAFAQSDIHKVLVEKYLHHWKEIEFEVVRDAYDNSAAIACLENLDPMGVHTGESVVIAPCQTLTNREYQILRDASILVAKAVSLIGEGNVQLALDPHSETYYVIETNPRMSRSSALASKATGYPLAYIAAKLALGYKLHEILNKVTGVTKACFEPSLDYVTIKVPRWDLQKFEGVEKSIGSEMKSIGEVMAIGRNVAEALQKAIRMLDIGEIGLVGGRTFKETSLEEALRKLKNREPYWPIYVAKAIYEGYSIDELYKLTGIDKYFLYWIKEVVDVFKKLEKGGDAKLISYAKVLGFSDEQLREALGKEFERGKPFVKQIDTLAAEWPASTNYLYVTYDASEDDIPFTNKKKVIVLGAGVFRIGVSVEFDWAVVNLADALKKKFDEVIVINYNPETVSTDWDVNDKLYFEELTKERVLDVYEKERAYGVIAFVGGQISNNLAKPLEESGVRLLGTSGKSVDIAEDRSKFSALLDKLGIKQPPWTVARDVNELKKFADEYGYPLLIRPSYVLSGAAMRIIRNEKELEEALRYAIRVNPKYPAVVSKFFEGAKEAELDGVGDSRKTVVIPVSHIEPAGVHSGDSTMVTPPKLSQNIVRRMKEIAIALVRELEIKGPYNIQFLIHNNEVYVIELNLRASRSMPFTSKSRGVNLMELTAKVLTEGSLGVDEEIHEPPALAYAVKSPQFSWAQLKGAYPELGPEMRSTGEVASLSYVYEEALLLSWLSATPNKLPKGGVLVYGFTERELLKPLVKTLSELFDVYTIQDDINAERVSTEKAVDLIKRGKIDLVITSGSNKKVDYKVRRTAVDLNVPLVLDLHLGLELARAFRYLSKKGGLNYEYLEVRELSEYWKPLLSKEAISFK